MSQQKTTRVKAIEAKQDVQESRKVGQESPPSKSWTIKGTWYFIRLRLYHFLLAIGYYIRPIQIHRVQFLIFRGETQRKLLYDFTGTNGEFPSQATMKYQVSLILKSQNYDFTHIEIGTIEEWDEKMIEGFEFMPESLSLLAAKGIELKKQEEAEKARLEQVNPKGRLKYSNRKKGKIPSLKKR